MAILDTLNNEVVIRVVYDGPPEAGKTTSIRALATSFSQSSTTPSENETGRTQWFDWMEYVGGRFEGSQIRCQIVSVPGQRELSRRRELLVASADVIVFVGDTSPDRWELSLEYLLELHGMRDKAAPVGIVFQANKRDVAGAVKLAEIRSRLGDARWDVGVVESVASDGTGIREAFVYGVRLALDRVRELISSGKLREGRPDELSPSELLARLQAGDTPPSTPPPPTSTSVATVTTTLDESAWDAPDFVITPSSQEVTVELEPVSTDLAAIAQEAAATIEASLLEVVGQPQIESNPESVAATLLNEVIASQVIDSPPALPPIPSPPRPKLAMATHVPTPPDASVPSGAIWPPVEGRTILMEVSQIELVPRRHTNGDWSAGLGSGWRLVSKRDAVFDSLDAGRNALVQWARLHAACMNVVSPHRCIVLASTGDGRWRLWQIVRAEESLRDLVERVTVDAEPDQVLESLCQTAELLVQVNERLAEAPCELPVSLDTVGACDASGMYIGLMPEAPIEPSRPRVSPSTLLETELGPMLALDLAERRTDLGRALQSKAATALAHGETVIESLQRLLE